MTSVATGATLGLLLPASPWLPAQAAIALALVLYLASFSRSDTSVRVSGSVRFLLALIAIGWLAALVREVLSPNAEISVLLEISTQVGVVLLAATTYLGFRFDGIRCAVLGPIGYACATILTAFLNIIGNSNFVQQPWKFGYGEAAIMLFLCVAVRFRMRPRTALIGSAVLLLASAAADSRNLVGALMIAIALAALSCDGLLGTAVPPPLRVLLLLALGCALVSGGFWAMKGGYFGDTLNLRAARYSDVGSFILGNRPGLWISLQTMPQYMPWGLGINGEFSADSRANIVYDLSQVKGLIVGPFIEDRLARGIGLHSLAADLMVRQGVLALPFVSALIVSSYKVVADLPRKVFVVRMLSVFAVAMTLYALAGAGFGSPALGFALGFGAWISSKSASLKALQRRSLVNTGSIDEELV